MTESGNLKVKRAECAVWRHVWVEGRWHGGRGIMFQLIWNDRFLRFSWPVVQEKKGRDFSLLLTDNIVRSRG